MEIFLQGLTLVLIIHLIELVTDFIMLKINSLHSKLWS